VVITPIEVKWQVRQPEQTRWPSFAPVTELIRSFLSAAFPATPSIRFSRQALPNKPPSRYLAYPIQQMAENFSWVSTEVQRVRFVEQGISPVNSGTRTEPNQWQ
jgi:hypothetical protein